MRVRYRWDRISATVLLGVVLAAYAIAVINTL